MSTNTTNYNLVKPATTDNVDISVINSNMDIVDTQLKTLSTSVSTNTSNISTNTTDISNIISQANKNLLEITATSQTVSGVTFTINADKSISASGTATTYSSIALTQKIPVSVGKKYLLHLDGNFTNVMGIVNTYKGVSQAREIGTVEADENKIAFIIQDGETDIVVSLKRVLNVATSGIIYPMLEEIPNLCTLPYNCHYQTGGSGNNATGTCKDTVYNIPKDARNGKFTSSCYVKRYSDEDLTNQRLQTCLYYTDGTNEQFYSEYNAIPNDGVEHFVSLVATTASGKTVSKIETLYHAYSSAPNIHYEVRAPRLEIGDTTSGYTPSEYVPYGVNSLGTIIQYLTDKVQSLQQSIISLGGNV